MRTLNTNEDLPEYFYIFTGHMSPLARYNFQLTKAITSGAFSNIGVNGDFLQKYLNGQVDYLRFVPSETTDIHSPSSFSMATTSNYTIEYNAELYRRQHLDTHLYPSRLSCVFAFGDLGTCRLVSELFPSWRLEDVRRFTLDVNQPLDALTRVVKANMSIATAMLDYGNLAAFDQQEQEKIWNIYWRGQEELALQIPWEDEGMNGRIAYSTIWEYLIEGRLVLDEGWHYDEAA